MNTTEDKKEVMIGFFLTKRSDFLVSHNHGLTKEQVEMLKNLKEGDRLKVWVNREEPGRSRLSLGVLVEEKASL